MLDIKFVVNNPKVIIEDLKKRGEEDLIKEIDVLIKAYNEFLRLKKEVDLLRKERNVLIEKITSKKRKGENALSEIEKMKKLNEEIKKKEVLMESKERTYREILLMIPNLTHPSVPKGEGEEDNVVIKEVGRKREFGFEPRDHIAIFEKRGWFDLERASKVAGARFYYLRGDAVILEFALLRYAIDFLRSKGFEIMTVPMLAREESFYGTGFLPRGKEDLYKIEGEDMYLIGTAEVCLGAYHMNETLLRDSLPLRYGGVSSCFRTEAGSHGRDTKGIFRVHQFEKIEMYSFTLPEQSWDEHEYLLSIAEEFYKTLELPYRVVNICSGDLGWTASKKYDIEVYLPGQGKYREVVSCSNTTDYQARRLNIKYREKEGEKPKGFVHTLNSTLTAIQRTIIGIVENYQQEDYRIRVPKVLVPYVGKEVL